MSERISPEEIARLRELYANATAYGNNAASEELENAAVNALLRLLDVAEDYVRLAEENRMLDEVALAAFGLQDERDALREQLRNMEANTVESLLYLEKYDEATALRDENERLKAEVEAMCAVFRDQNVAVVAHHSTECFRELDHRDCDCSLTERQREIDATLNRRREGT